MITERLKTTLRWLSYNCYVSSSVWYGEGIDRIFVQPGYMAGHCSCSDREKPSTSISWCGNYAPWFYPRAVC